PIDLQVVGSDLQADRQYANALLARIRQIPGIADARIQQAFQQPTLNANVDRSLAGLVGLSEKDAATAMLTTLAGSSQTSPTYWLDPKTGVTLPVAGYNYNSGWISFCWRDSHPLEWQLASLHGQFLPIQSRRSC